ncbi:MAG: Bbp16 family capsid cement protein [Opitutia bacterium]
MVNDINLRVSTAQAVTVTAVSVDSVDLQNARDVGEGEDLYMVFTVGTAFTGGTSISFEVLIADNGPLTTNPTVLAASPAIPTAQLIAGSQFAVRFSPVASLRAPGAVRRFLGARYTVVGAMTAGTVTADVVHTIQGGNRFYPSGFTVL